MHSHLRYKETEAQPHSNDETKVWAPASTTGGLMGPRRTPFAEKKLRAGGSDIPSDPNPEVRQTGGKPGWTGFISNSVWLAGVLVQRQRWQ
jgi:hypothetical protein